MPSLITLPLAVGAGWYINLSQYLLEESKNEPEDLIGVNSWFGGDIIALGLDLALEPEREE